MRGRILTLLGLAIGLGTPGLRAQGMPPLPVPAGNPITADKAKLGKALFWDEQLSSTGTVACGTCHVPSAGGTDPRALDGLHPGPDFLFGTPDDIRGSLGVIQSFLDGTFVKSPDFGLRPQVTPRKAPSMINAAYNTFQFWDGRADFTFKNPVSGAVLLPWDASLESQAVGPPVSPVEMAHLGVDWPSIAARIAGARPLALASSVPAELDAWIGTHTYRELFTIAFGPTDVTPAMIAMAIATYERTLISGQAPIDDYVLNGNQNALTAQQRRGLDVFQLQAACVACHDYPTFENNGFFALGVRPKSEDHGRYLITAAPADDGAFKTPSLRNVGLHRTFMHNGGFRSLREVVDFYDRGGDFPGPNVAIFPLGLTEQEKVDLVAFLEGALTDPRVAQELPPFDRPTLYSESTRRPAAVGAGAPGSGGFVPRLVALEPPMLGNPSMTFGLAEGLGQAPAFLMLDIAPGVGASLLGVPIHVGGSGAFVALPLGLLTDVGAGEGYKSVSFAIPTAPSLAGLDLYFQGIVADPGALFGWSGTAGVRARLFAQR